MNNCISCNKYCVMKVTLLFGQNSCSLNYTFSRRTGYHPFELVVEDFPKRRIQLSYSNRYYTWKYPHRTGRYTRQSTTQLNVTFSSNNTSFQYSNRTSNTSWSTNATSRRRYRPSIPPLSRLPLQFSIYGVQIFFVLLY